jgi:putative serine protease PepD
MTNKIFIGLFVFLFLVSCSLAGTTVYLNNQINTVSDNLNAFKTDTANTLTAMQADISALDSRLTTFQTETNNHLNTIDSSISSLNSNLADLTAQFAESTINAQQVYDSVIDSVCQIIGDASEDSGFIITADGYIVTCWHVVNGQSYLDVKLHDGRVASGIVIGSDRASDVAVIKINGFTDLKPLSFADSGAVAAGQPVIAIGNPRGTFETVVSGIISRTRGIEYVGGVGWVSNLIQYDAATNPGNSGSPVLNNEGKVVGMVESGYTSYYQCINFAVASNKIARVSQALINTGSFVTAILPGSWSLSDLTPDVALALGLNTSFGVIFTDVSDLDQVQVNDVIVAIDGVDIQDGADLFSYLTEFKSVGDTVTLTLLRSGGVEVEVSLTLVAGWIS